MEIASLVLGAATAVIPVYAGIDKLLNTITAVRHHHGQLRQLWLEILTQKTKLKNECVLLFGDGSGCRSNEIKAMLGNHDHPNWKDGDFQQKLSEHLGKAFEQDDLTTAFQCSLAPFELIKSTVDELNEELNRFASTVAEQCSAAAIAAAPAKTPIQASWKSKATGMVTGVAWSMNKAKLQDLQRKLRDQINNLIQLREQRDKLTEFRVPKPHNNFVARKQEKTPFSTILEVRASSRRLYQAVSAVKNCRCHCIDFQLPRIVSPVTSSKTMTIAGSEAISTHFNLLIAPVSDKTSFTCIMVRPERTLAVAGQPAATITAVVSPTQQRKPSAIKRTLSSGSRQPARVTRARYGSLEQETRGTHAIATPPHTTIDISQPPEQTMYGTLQSWCSVTAVELRINCALPVPPTPYIGVLPNVDSYRHVLQRAETPPSGSRMSLREVITLANSSPRKKIFSWPNKRRYELAHFLASSVLHCAECWFKPGWRSGDINFLIPPNQLIGDETMKFPYVSSAAISPPTTPGTELARNDHLFSLAIALIEIGYGDSLHNLCPELEQSAQADLYLKEFLAAKRLARAIASEMGKQYSLVVQRCLECNFGLDDDDLDNRDMQDAFHSRVICVLRECLRYFGE